MAFKDVISYLFPKPKKKLEAEKPQTEKQGQVNTPIPAVQKPTTSSDDVQNQTPSVTKGQAQGPAPTVSASPAPEKPKTPTPPKADDVAELAKARKVFEQGMTSIKDLIAPTSFSVSPNEIEMSGMHAQSFYVYTYPRYIETNWLSPIINFEANIDLSLFIYPIQNEQIMKVLRNKVGQMNSHIRILNKSGKARDPLIETAVQDAEELRLSKSLRKSLPFDIS